MFLVEFHLDVVLEALFVVEFESCRIKLADKYQRKIHRKNLDELFIKGRELFNHEKIHEL